MQLDQVRSQIGKVFRHGALRYRLVDVLADPSGPALVLQALDLPPSIQGNQYGDASRLAPRLLTIPMYADDGKSLNPALQELEPSIAP